MKISFTLPEWLLQLLAFMVVGGIITLVFGWGFIPGLIIGLLAFLRA